jgi:uracil-DNA glycosylase family 4
MPRVGEPSRDCALCPRLRDFREAWRSREKTWHNAPVPSFGSIDSRLLIVGLAPGLRGANATGRPFTGDYAGDLLYATLREFGFASGNYGERADDGLGLIDCRITNAVRCVPPENKPTTSEINTCRSFLSATISEMPKLTHVLVLGAIAHQSTMRALGGKPSQIPFRHGGVVAVGRLQLHSSYHCSRYNTNTGVLTEAMFRAVFAELRRALG